MPVLKQVQFRYLLFADRERIRSELLTSIQWRELLSIPPSDSESMCSWEYKDCSAGFEFLRRIQSVFFYNLPDDFSTLNYTFYTKTCEFKLFNFILEFFGLNINSSCFYQHH